MRHKIVTILAVGAVGAVGATSFTVAGNALASTTTPVAATVTTAVTSQLDRLKAALAGLVTDKTLTQAQADKVAETLKSTELGHGERGGMGGGHGGMRGGTGGGHGHGGAGLDAAATALKMTQAELRSALAGGKTLAAVAKEKGVSVASLVTVLVNEKKAQIAQAVKDGRLTQAEADQRLKELTTRVTERINSTPADHPQGAPGGGLASTPSR